MYTCASCTVLACANNEPDKMPRNCPMRNTSVMENSRDGYDLPENHDFYINCSSIEGLGYCQWPRLKETIEFCKRMNLRPCAIPSHRQSCWMSSRPSLTLRSVCASDMTRCFINIRMQWSRHWWPRIVFWLIIPAVPSIAQKDILKSGWNKNMFRS